MPETRTPYLSRLLRLFLLLLALATVGILPQMGTAAQSGVTPLQFTDSGFQDVRVVSGLLAPRDFAFLPDGRILILDRGSATTDDLSFASIRVFANGSLLPQRAWTRELCAGGEQGLLGLAVDPNFSSNNFVYIYYTAILTSSPRTCVNRVVRLTMSGNTLGNDRTLVDNIASLKDSVHNAGDLAFDSQGFLYASTGNTGITEISSANSVLNGKILRIRPDNSAQGYSTVGNPFDGAANSRLCGVGAAPAFQPPLPANAPVCREIWATGLRNPFRTARQPALSGIPGTDSIWAGDVGDGRFEEINQIVGGGNYGYPTCEGPCNPPRTGLTQPVYAYPHPAGGGAAVILGDFYTGSSYPAQYRNNLFYLDYVTGVVSRLAYNGGAARWEAQPTRFAQAPMLTITSMQAGPDGNLYYINRPGEQTRNSEIRVIRYGAATNNPPQAAISASNPTCALNADCSFSGAGSFDPDQGDSLASYRWAVRYVGDSTDVFTTTTTTNSFTYRFTQARNAAVTLIVRDSRGADSQPASVNVFPGNQPPTGQIVLQNLTNPARGAALQFHAGDRWSYRVNNLADPDDALPANPVSWAIVMHHNDHTHPYLSLTGQSGEFTIPLTYHQDFNIWYRIQMFITDARGQTFTYPTGAPLDIRPVLTNVTFASQPAGASITIDGVPRTAPYTTQYVVGTELRVESAASFTLNNQVYPFINWADSSNRARTLYVQPGNLTYTANYGAPLTPTPAPLAFTVQVASGADDVNQSGSTYEANLAPMYIGNAGVANSGFTGLRFTNLSIPRGAQVVSARLELYALSQQWNQIDAEVAAEATDNSAPFSAGSGPATRPLTTARLRHSSNTQWLANQWYTYQDVTAVIQEVVNRGGWQPGNSLSIIVRGLNGDWARKMMASFESNPALAPRLVIQLQGGNPTVPPPSATPLPTLTATPLPTRTATPLPSATPLPTLTATLPPSATPLPTLTATPLPSATVAPPALLGDINGDGAVTLADFALLSISYNRREGETGYDARADLNGDRAVTLADFSMLTGNFNCALPNPDPRCVLRG
jgi:glucose/arabinose dehydrogenase